MIQTKRRMKFTKTSKRSGAATLLRQSENVLGIAQAVRSRSNRALGFVNKHRVHLLTVKGINPAPHIHEHLRYTIMATALRTPSRKTTSRLSTLR